MKVKSLEEIRAVCEAVAAPMNIEIVEVEFKQSKNPALTVFAETETGIDLDTLEKLHNALELPLDELDPTFGAAYTLNVSSPGLDRPFKTARDFERNIGTDVELKLFSPYRGEKYFEGELTNYDGNTVTVKTAKDELKFQLNQIAKISKAVKFD